MGWLLAAFAVKDIVHKSRESGSVTYGVLKGSENVFEGTVVRSIQALPTSPESATNQMYRNIMGFGAQAAEKIKGSSGSSSSGSSRSPAPAQRLPPPNQASFNRLGQPTKPIYAVGSAMNGGTIMSDGSIAYGPAPSVQPTQISTPHQVASPNASSPKQVATPEVSKPTAAGSARYYTTASGGLTTNPAKAVSTVVKSSGSDSKKK